jgi:hypothetical protein
MARAKDNSGRLWWMEVVDVSPCGRFIKVSGARMRNSACGKSRWVEAVSVKAERYGKTDRTDRMLQGAFADDPELGRKVSDTFKARAAIIEHSHGKRGIKGKLPCPICGGGALHYSVAANGHVWATCTTPDCVRWIE